MDASKHFSKKLKLLTQLSNSMRVSRESKKMALERRCLFRAKKRIANFKDIVTDLGKEDYIQEESLEVISILVIDKSVLMPGMRKNRRKLKIVPVGDQPLLKKCKLDPSSTANLKPPKKYEKDVVMLFTSYTMDCFYINDHDYLISPYRRNKILFEEDRRWMCMCYICNSRHIVTEHVKHMSMHGSKCILCACDLGTPYMHNIHLKTHKKPCRYCTQILPYCQIKSHEMKHIEEEQEEEEIYEESKKKGHMVRRGKRRPNKDEKPVYFAIPKCEMIDIDKNDGYHSEGSTKTVITLDKSVVKDNSDNLDASTIKRKGRGRPRRKTNEEDASDTLESPRTLRTRVKKRYVESDDEENQDKEKDSSCSKEGTSSDSKECEK